ncbi:MAG: ABC transporter permease [Opitutia bacterium Tous-C1TDCM]|nr:MAG: ABC transporter permease [Opitutae bacterium Tous-C1TDCM]
MFRLALKMLVGDRGKYALLVSGLTFSTMLMAQAMCLFCGIMSWTVSSVRNIRASVWVSDPMVEQVNDNKPLRSSDLSRVRSVPGVAWAAPLYQGAQQARLAGGDIKGITLVGLDSATLAGAPGRILAGRLEDLRLPNTVIIDEFAVERFSEATGRAFGIGDVFEINDREARVVGICRAERSFTGGPYIFTQYERALDYAPAQRKMLSFILVGAAPGYSADEVAAAITAATGLRGWSESALIWSTLDWYIANTGIPINIGLLVVVGFVVGIVFSAQTFYAFVLDNLRNLAALKAMGLTARLLVPMLLLQAITVGSIGYGFGMLLTSSFGFFTLGYGRIAYLMPWQVPVVAGAAVLSICVFSALLGITKVVRTEPAIVFR